MATKNETVAAHLKPLRDDLTAKQAAALKALEPAYAERDKLIAQIQPLEAKLREVQQTIKKGEAPLRDIGNTLAQIARATGAARSMPIEAGQTTATPAQGR